MLVLLSTGKKAKTISVNVFKITDFKNLQQRDYKRYSETLSHMLVEYMKKRI